MSVDMWVGLTGGRHSGGGWLHPDVVCSFLTPKPATEANPGASLRSAPCVEPSSFVLKLLCLCMMYMVSAKARRIVDIRWVYSGMFRTVLAAHGIPPV